jgi:hypothetical protein
MVFSFVGEWRDRHPASSAAPRAIKAASLSASKLM